MSFGAYFSSTQPETSVPEGAQAHTACAVQRFFRRLRGCRDSDGSAGVRPHAGQRPAFPRAAGQAVLVWGLRQSFDGNAFVVVPAVVLLVLVVLGLRPRPG